MVMKRGASVRPRVEPGGGGLQWFVKSEFLNEF